MSEAAARRQKERRRRAAYYAKRQKVWNIITSDLSGYLGVISHAVLERLRDDLIKVR